MWLVHIPIKSPKFEEFSLDFKDVTSSTSASSITYLQKYSANVRIDTLRLEADANEE